MNLSNEKTTLNVYSIERMGMFDGPGVRYVLFLQGCPFKCKYCHNRDSWSTDENKIMSVEDVWKDFKKYVNFYNPPALTVSGGEPLLQLGALTELFKYFKAQGVHNTLDTSGGLFNLARKESYLELLKYTDLVLLDIKHIDNEVHKELVGTSNTHILEFARFLDEHKIKMIIRHVLVPGVTDDEPALKKMREFLDTLHNVIKIEILPYHTKGIRKWEALGLEYPLKGVREPTKDEVVNALNILTRNYKFAK